MRYRPQDEAVEAGWKEALRPFLEAAIWSVSRSEQRLLYLATPLGLQFDLDGEELPTAHPESLMDELFGALQDIAENGYIRLHRGARVAIEEISEKRAIVNIDFRHGAEKEVKGWGAGELAYHSGLQRDSWSCRFRALRKPIGEHCDTPRFALLTATP